MFNPHGRQGTFGVFEMEEETEDELVSEDGFAGDGEGEREVDSVVELKKITRYMRI